MAYHALTEKTLVDYFRGRPALAEHLPHGAALSVREVGDGNLNLVFVVSNRAEPAQAVIVKQALNYLRVAGESWPLTRERMRFESQAMLLYNELCPGLVPRVYDYDAEMSLMVAPVRRFCDGVQFVSRGGVAGLEEGDFDLHVTCRSGGC